ncbi:glycosyl hydrolase [Geofilum sp. OHC36d9]|uniref:glycosyl hydrolase n=1 Tax=Geofilum sp. OHC36d9 TaxID=3458413 RepID=UPI00403405E7
MEKSQNYQNSQILNEICFSRSGLKFASYVRLMMVVMIWFMFNGSVLAAKIETTATLTESRVLEEACELHITSSDNPLSAGVTIALNHEDAWVFFDNLKPSFVVEHFLDRISVNGAAFVTGTNGRIAIYAQGTVLMPHADTYKPLSVFTDENYGGKIAKYGVHTYYNNLGEFDNAIKSFKLKRGYMVTLATESDGSGYSRVFIADTTDLDIEVMPEFLNANVSFIRVFKYQWVTKKGWAGWNQDEYEMTNSTWYYDWSAGGSTSFDVEYAVIKQNSGWPSWSDINSKTNVTHLLGFNEPDRPDQSNIDFDDALAMWPQFMASGLRLGAPATSDPFNSWSLFNFIDKCDELNYRVDFVAIHAYWGGKSAQQWYNDLKYIHNRTGRPIWITEWNNGANWTTESSWPDDPSEYTDANAQKQLNDLKAILEVLDTASFVERYSIYNWVEDARAMVLNGELTLAGEYYANNNSRIAYNSNNDVIPEWNYLQPSLSLRHLTLSNTIRLSWNNTNGDLAKGFILEKKVNSGAYEEIYNVDDISVLSFVDPLDSDIRGSVSYRLKVKTVEGTNIVSNEVSYYQTSGENSIQAATFSVGTTDWVQSIFAEKYETAPIIISGIPSFNNVMPITTRVNSVSTTSFLFQFDPWNYLNTPVFSKSENLSVLAMPEGVYNFSGLKGIAGVVSGMDKNWQEVTFEESFETVPVVLCTQVSNSTSFATTVALRNVSKTGFEVRLKSEEAVTSPTLAEKINFLAIECGQGIIGSFRVTVGRTEDGEDIAADKIIVPIDNSYIEPAVFAGLLTESNDFASTMRYYYSDESEISLFKQREMSGSLAVVEKDHVGWLIMDVGEQQPLSDIDTRDTNNLPFYPNPVSDNIYFNFKSPTHVELYDLSGNQVDVSNVQNSLSVSFLPAGIYFIKSPYGVGKFVKK